MTESILSYLWSAVLASLLQIGIFLLPGLLITLLMNYVSTKLQQRAVGIIGRGWFLGLFGWLGTAVHELGHAFFCLVFGHKIVKISLFEPDPETGTLGYVEHTYEPTNIYQMVGNFFTGIGPILFGTALIYLALYLLLSINALSFVQNISIGSATIYSWDVPFQTLQTLWQSSTSLISAIFTGGNFSSWQLYVFLYIAFCIGSFITLSPPDIKGSLKGMGVILVLILVFNLATVWIGDVTSNIFLATISYYLVFYTALFLILMMDIAVSLVLLLPLSFVQQKQSAE
jgi:hypothetical protein